MLRAAGQSAQFAAISRQSGGSTEELIVIFPSVSIRILQPPNDGPPNRLRPTNALGYLGAYPPHAPAMTVANPFSQHALTRISPFKDFAGGKRRAVDQKRAPHLPL
jgi:hypothetical protein